MSIIKRLTEVLTPPIRRRTSSDRDQGSVVESTGAETPRLSDLKDILWELLTRERISPSATNELLTKIKEIAKQYGTVVTAAEIRDTVLRMPDANQSTAPVKKRRGYELAADLLRQSIYAQLRRVEEDDDCGALDDVPDLAFEMLASSFLAEKHIKGIETCLAVVEELLERACYHSLSSAPCLELADRLMTQTVDMVLVEDERLAQARRSAERAGVPEAATFRGPLESALLANLAVRRDAVQNLCERLATLPKTAVLPPRERPDAITKVDLHAHMTFLLAVAQAAIAEICPVLAAYALEHAAEAGALLRHAKTSSYAKHAALLYRKAAAAEGASGFHVAKRKHLEAAAALQKLTRSG